MNFFGLTASSLRVLEALHVAVQDEIVLRGGKKTKRLKKADSFNNEGRKMTGFPRKRHSG